MNNKGGVLQNFLDIDFASPQGSPVRVVGTLNSSSEDDFTIDFCETSKCDPGDFGEDHHPAGQPAKTFTRALEWCLSPDA